MITENLKKKIWDGKPGNKNTVSEWKPFVQGKYQALP